MENVFIRNKKTQENGYTVASLTGVRPTSGEIGLEIEVEGNKFLKNNSLLPKGWIYEKDHSLRGHDNAEYIFQSPKNFNEVPEMVKNLFNMFDEYGSVLDESNRTSVHVHLNAQNFHLNRLCSFTALYLSVEEILTAWCGDHRVGNLFCLRATDAPGIVSKIKAFLQTGSSNSLTEGLHYAGVNAHALNKFGSMEFRALKGVQTPEPILLWVSVLERIYKLSEQFTDPRDICGQFSGGGGALEYFKMVLGSNTSEIRNNLSMTDQEIEESLYRGIRIAQELCYCRDWSLYKPVNLQPDPFKRSFKKVADSLQDFSIGSENMVEAYTKYNSIDLSISTPQWATASTDIIDEIDDYEF